MSKTYSLQIEKARLLVDGMRKNFDAVKGLGVTEEIISSLEQKSQEADQLNDELDALRLQVAEKASVANKKLNDLRIQVQELKQLIKKNFDQTRWESLGIPDKR